MGNIPIGTGNATNLNTSGPTALATAALHDVLRCDDVVQAAHVDTYLAQRADLTANVTDTSYRRLDAPNPLAYAVRRNNRVAAYKIANHIMGETEQLPGGYQLAQRAIGALKSGNAPRMKAAQEALRDAYSAQPNANDADARNKAQLTVTGASFLTSSFAVLRAREEVEMRRYDTAFKFLLVGYSVATYGGIPQLVTNQVQDRNLLLALNLRAADFMLRFSRGRERLTADGKRSVFGCVDHCNLEFPRREHLARHLRGAAGIKPFVCIEKDCMTPPMTRYDNLRQHTRVVHKFELPSFDDVRSIGIVRQETFVPNLEALPPRY